jgi:hypothetical protein
MSRHGNISKAMTIDSALHGTSSHIIYRSYDKPVPSGESLSHLWLSSYLILSIWFRADNQVLVLRAVTTGWLLGPARPVRDTAQSSDSAFSHVFRLPTRPYYHLSIIAPNDAFQRSSGCISRPLTQVTPIHHLKSPAPIIDQSSPPRPSL